MAGTGIALLLTTCFASPAAGQSGTVDSSYNSGTGPNNTVYALAIQSDGQHLVGGEFTEFNGAAVGGIVRLNASGAVDATFNPGSGADDSVFAVAVQSSGKVVIGGLFTMVNGMARERIAQLNADGTLDASFAPSPGANGTVYAVGVYTNGPNVGKVLIGGVFTRVNGTSRPFLARLNADGSLDTTFNPGFLDGEVYAISVQSDGRIVIGGAFTQVGGVSRAGVARIEANGALDTTFSPGTGTDSAVLALALQPDGRVVIGGLFGSVNGTSRNGVARLNADGSLDAGFLNGQSGANDYVSAVAIQADGKVLIGGGFTAVNGFERNRFARLNSDGTADGTINIGSGANNFVTSLAVQGDGNILVGGGFTSFNDVNRNYLARIFGGDLAGGGSFVFNPGAVTAFEDQGVITLTVDRQSGLSGAVTVEFATVNGTGLADLDYIGTNGVLNFAPGQFSRTISIELLNDADLDGDKTFEVVLQNPTGGAVLGTPSTATVTLLDDDSTIGFETANYLADEGDGAASITLVRMGGTNRAASVTFFTRDGTAISPDDYTAVSTTVAFAAGERTRAVDIPINDDALSGEGNETVFLTLTNAAGAALGSANATLLIVENDFGAGVVELASDLFNVDEGAGMAVIHLTRRDGRTGFVSVSYTLSSGTAIGGADFGATSGTISFASGQTNRTLNVPIFEDSVIEGNETFTITLSNPTGGATLGRATAQVRIVDNDFTPGDPGRLEFDVSTLNISEDVGTASVVVRRSGGVTGTVGVGIESLNGTALAGSDFQIVSEFLEFGPGETTRTVTLTIFDDLVGEGTEGFFLRLFGASGGATLGMPDLLTVNIIENVLIPGSVGFVETNLFLFEGDGGVLLRIERTNGLTGEVTVDVQTMDGTAVGGVDYMAETLTVTFADGQASALVPISIIDNATTNENKSFTVVLLNPTGGLAIHQDTATITILDDDYEPGPGVIGFLFSNYATNESAGVARITLIRQLGRDGEVEVEYSTANGTATNGVHYVGTTNTLTFEDGEIIKTFDVPLIDNFVISPDRTVRLGLSSTNALSLRMATLTIRDDDKSFGFIEFACLEDTVAENAGTVAFRVYRLNGNFGNVTVDYVITDGTAQDGIDYVASSGTLFFGPNTKLQTILIPITDDAFTNGNRTINLTLLNIMGGAAPGTKQNAVLTIIDDEGQLTQGNAGQFVFTSANYSQTDRQGFFFSGIFFGNVYGFGPLITVTRTNGAVGKAMVDYEVTDPSDPLSPFFPLQGTLVFDDYQMSTNFVVPSPSSFGILGFRNRVLQMTLCNPRGAPGEPTPGLGPVSTATLTILDTRRGFNFSATVYRVPEWTETLLSPPRVELTIFRDPTSAGRISVGWEAPVFPQDYRYLPLQAGSDYAIPPEDYTPVSGRVTWADDDFDPKTIEIQIINDKLVEFNEDFFVFLDEPRLESGAGPDPTLGPASIATVTILMEDAERILDEQLGVVAGNVLPPGSENEQPAGAADLTWNRDRSGLIFDPNPPYNFAPGANNRVNATVVQPDGRLVLGGDFTAVNTIERNRIARLLTNGVLDVSFDPGTGADGSVSSLDIYTSGPNAGKFVIGGAFRAVNGVSRFGVARLNSDGSLDNTFRPGFGVDGIVRAVAVQADDKVLIGGDFTSFNGTNRSGIARLNADGSLDTTFNPGTGVNGTVYTIARESVPPLVPLQASGSGGGSHTNVVDTGFTSGTINLDLDLGPIDDNLRIYYEGNLLFETNFSGLQTVSIPFGPGNSTVVTIVLNEGAMGSPFWNYTGSVVPTAAAPLEKIIIGGSFTAYNGAEARSIARLNMDGSLDPTFNTGAGVNGTVFAAVVQTDEKVVIGGDFTEVNLRGRRGIARLNIDGRVDTTFLPGQGFDDAVFALALQPDGKILVGGVFTSFHGTRRMGAARLFPEGYLDTGFLDTAYNQFAGLPKEFSYEPTKFVRAIDYQVLGTNEYVFIGGSFTRVGGGYDRQDVRFRSNIARLVGGVTPGPGNIEFAFPSYNGDENGDHASVTLRRANGNLGGIAATLTTADGTAEAFSDYLPRFVIAVWQDFIGNTHSVGDQRQFVYFFPIIDDSVIEGNEFYSGILTNPASPFFSLGGEVIPLGAALGRSVAPITIIDDDFTPGVLGFTAPVFTVDEHGSVATIQVSRTNGSTAAVTVNYTTVDLTPGPTAAVANADYLPKSGTLTFASGETNKTITINILDDTGVEFDEEFAIILSNPTGGATLGLTQTRIAIIDNDFAAGRLNFAASDFSANESAGQVAVTVNRSGGSQGALTVQVRTENGSASAPADFIAVTNTLIWSDGDTMPKSFNVGIVDDNFVDPNETFSLSLFNPSVAGALGAISNALVTIVDNDAFGLFAFQSSGFLANENGVNATITVVRNFGSSETASVDYEALPGTATNGVDFTVTSGTLIFGPGETVKTFSVPLLDDPDPDGTKTVTLLLSSPQPGGAGLTFPNPATLTILDNESANVPAGSVDTSFRPEPGADGDVFALDLQSDGRILLGGDFRFVNSAVRDRIARLLPNGDLDNTFDPGTGANGSVRAVAVQPDNKVVIGGFFTSMNGIPQNHIARLNMGGTLDTSFDPGAGLDNPAYALGFQQNGTNINVIVGGSFTTVNGRPFNFIARLLPNGQPDPAFDPGLGANGTVFAVAVQPDGKILIGGEFTTVNNVSRPRIARLLPDGGLDTSFNPGLGANDSVRTIRIQSDGRILIGGLFTQYDGTTRNRIARLNPNGSLDSTFDPGPGANNAVYDIAVGNEGKLVVVGEFTMANGVTRNRITRMNPDGSVDPTINFGSGANGIVAAVELQPDGKIVIGGGFTAINEIPRNRVARLHGGTLSGPGRLEFAQPQFTATENGVNATITVRRIGGTAGSVSATFLTRPLTAVPGVHYNNVTGVVVFPTGETKQTFTVPLVDNQEVSSNRLVGLVLTNFVGATAGFQPTATLLIVNDDAIVGFNTATFSVNENTIGGRAIISVTRAGSSVGTVFVDFTTTGSGNATAGADYTATSGRLVFLPGETNKTFAIPIVDDVVAEGNETVGLALSNPAGPAQIGLGSATLTIVDNDFAPGAIRFSSATYLVQEDAGSITIIVVRTNGSTGIVSVDYATSDAGASVGSDYLAASGRLTFADGQVTNFFTIQILSDSLIETNESVVLTLSNPSGGAVLGTPSGATLTIQNVGGLPVPGSLDGSFNPGAGANNLIRTMAAQSDGKFVIGGAFTRFNNVARNFIARLNTNGTLDTTFNPGTGADGLVSSVEQQPGGQVLMGGAFLTVNGLSRVRVAQLLASGAVDGAFQTLLGLNAIVYAVAPHQGGVIIGGQFDNTPSRSIARLAANGSVDGTFNAGTGANGPVYAVAVQADGRILIAGDFTTVAGVPRGRIARLNADGSLDPSFAPSSGASGPIFAVALYNGQIVIGGGFTQYNGISRGRVARLNPDGSLDSSFAPSSGANNVVFAVAVHPNGKVLLGGDFTAVNGVGRNRFGRLNSDGSLDNTFASGSGADSTVYDIVIQSDGRVVIAGDFTTVHGQPRNRIARLHGDPSAPASAPQFAGVSIDGAGRAVLTLGAEPGVMYLIDASTDLLNWVNIGSVTASGPTVTFTDFNAPSFSFRFYRARAATP